MLIITGTGATGAATGGTGVFTGSGLGFLALPTLAGPPCGCDFLTLLGCPDCTLPDAGV